SIPRWPHGRAADATVAPPAAGMPAAATAAPSAAPSAKAPVMPADLTEADQALWRRCNQLHESYKAVQKTGATYAPRMKPLLNAIMNNRASSQDRATYCSLLSELINVVQREKDERSQYINDDCDRFDWFDEGTTAAERLASHK